MGRPAGRELTPNEVAKLRKLRARAAAARYDPTDDAPLELRSELRRLHATGASVRTLAAGLGTTKSRAGVLLAQAPDRRTA